MRFTNTTNAQLTISGYVDGRLRSFTLPIGATMTIFFSALASATQALIQRGWLKVTPAPGKVDTRKPIVDWRQIANIPQSFPPSRHEHVIGEILGLKARLDALASQLALDGLLEDFNTHVAENDAHGATSANNGGTIVMRNESGSFSAESITLPGGELTFDGVDGLLTKQGDGSGLSGVGLLDIAGKLLTSQLPDLAVSEYLGPAADQAAMLLLEGESGDWCIRTDLSTVWIITGATPSDIGSWTQMSYPTAPVTSVAGKTGAVTLTVADVTGAVEGPGSSVNNSLPVFSGLTGKLLADSGIAIDNVALKNVGQAVSGAWTFATRPSVGTAAYNTNDTGAASTAMVQLAVQAATSRNTITVNTGGGAAGPIGAANITVRHQIWDTVLNEKDEPYTVAFYLTTTNAKAGDTRDFYVTMPAVPGYELVIRTNSSGGTILTTLASADIVGTRLVSFYYTGSAWAMGLRSPVDVITQLADLKSYADTTLTAHIDDPTAAHAASAISTTGGGNVQTALDNLDSGKLPVNYPEVTGALRTPSITLPDLYLDPVETAQIFADGRVLWFGDNAYGLFKVALAANQEGTISLAGLTSARTYTMPDASGTIALTADITASNLGGLGAGVATALTNPLDGTGGLASKSYADSLVVGLLDDRGNYDASGNLFPSSGGSGAAGAILKGDLWTISGSGALGGTAVTAGDVLRALVDAPGQTAGNWVITENNLGYVPQNTAGTLTLSGFSSIVGTLAVVNGGTGATTASGARDALGATAGVFPGSLVATATSTTAGVTKVGGTDPGNAATVKQLDRLTPPLQQNGKGSIITAASYFPSATLVAVSGTMYMAPILGDGRTVSGASVRTTGAASGLTLAKVGLYTFDDWVDGQGVGASFTGVSLVAETASFTTLGANSDVGVSFIAPVVLVRGKPYYLGVLQVGTTPATLRSVPVADGLSRATSPNGQVIESLSDLPANFTGMTTTSFGVPVWRGALTGAQV